MIRIHNKEQMNPLELMIVHDRLVERGVKYASIQPGNDCIWVSSGSSSCPINEYFIFRNSQLVDVQID